MYLSAFDRRVAASAPACYPSDFGIDFTWQGGTADGEQRWPGGLSLLLNKADLAVARAPAATHLSLTTNDQCFPVAGGRMCLADAGRAFAAFGAAGNLTATEAEGPHGFMNRTREGVYGFFQRILQKLPADVAEDPRFADQDMLVPYVDLGAPAVLFLGECAVSLSPPPPLP